MRGGEEKHPFQGWLNVGADMQRPRCFVFRCAFMQEYDKECDALAYHMKGAEKHLNLISALYSFLTKTLL